jgi:hypothetical protein
MKSCASQPLNITQVLSIAIKNQLNEKWYFIRLSLTICFLSTNMQKL